MTTTRRAKPGISKATGYKTEIFNIVYDMRGGLQAYGEEFMIWLIYSISSGVEVKSVQHALELWEEYQLEHDMNNEMTEDQEAA